jgi:hypothetical protein
MKQTRSLINGLLVCGIAFAMVSTLPAQTTKEEVAKVIRIHGAARCQLPGGTWQDLRVGDIIRPGSVIQSGIEGSSYVDVMIGRGAGPLPTLGSPVYRRPGATGYAAQARRTVIHLYANTVLGVDKLVETETGAAVVTETELDLRKGHLLGNVNKLTAGSEFRVRYPKGVAGVRGQIFDMTVEYVRIVNPATNVASETVQCTFAMASGTGVVTYTQPDGTTVTEVVQAMQSWSSGNPTVTISIPSGELATINQTIPTLTAPPAGVVHLVDPGQVEIQYVTGTKGGTTTPVGGVIQ